MATTDGKMDIIRSMFIGLQVIYMVRSQINWTLVKSPITLGSDVHLLCNITCCVKDTNSHAIWSIENGVKKSLSSNLITTNDAKYEILTSKHGCRLVIKNFGLEDANMNYTCVYNFDSYSRNLTLDEKSFEYIPKDEEIFIHDKVENKDLMVSVNITKSFPLPLCEVKFNGKNITSGLQRKVFRYGIFYSTQLEIKQPVVHGRFFIQCVIGTETIKISDIHVYRTQDGGIAEVICWVLGGILFVIILVLVAKKYQNPQQLCENTGELVITDIRELPESNYQDNDFSNVPLLSVSTNNIRQRGNFHDTQDDDIVAELAPKLNKTETDAILQILKSKRQAVKRTRYYTN